MPKLRSRGGLPSLARIVALSLLLALATTRASAQDAQRDLVIGVHDSPPFVMSANGTYAGLAIDLWEMIAKDLGYRFTYREYNTVREMIDATAAGEIDVAVTNLTITEDRTARIDFTQPWYDSGLRIMVNDNSNSGFRGLLAGLKDSGFLRAYAWLAFAIIAASIGFMLFDRKFDKSFPKTYRDGFAESFHTVMTVAVSGKPPNRKNLFGWLGRMWQGLWLAFGIVVVAFVTSSVTSVMTSLSIKNNIRSVADLPGLSVAVTEGSTAESFARSNGLTTILYPRVSASAAALLAGDVQAVIGDRPVLEYHAYQNADQPLSVVGAVFNPEKYGFGLPRNSDLRKAITIEVVGAREDGTLHDLATKYLGLNP